MQKSLGPTTKDEPKSKVKKPVAPKTPRETNGTKAERTPPKKRKTKAETETGDSEKDKTTSKKRKKKEKKSKEKSSSSSSGSKKSPDDEDGESDELAPDVFQECKEKMRKVRKAFKALNQLDESGRKKKKEVFLEALGEHLQKIGSHIDHCLKVGRFEFDLSDSNLKRVIRI